MSDDTVCPAAVLRHFHSLVGLRLHEILYHADETTVQLNTVISSPTRRFAMKLSLSLSSPPLYPWMSRGHETSGAIYRDTTVCGSRGKDAMGARVYI